MASERGETERDSSQARRGTGAAAGWWLVHSCSLLPSQNHRPHININLKVTHNAFVPNRKHDTKTALYQDVCTDAESGDGVVRLVVWPSAITSLDWELRHPTHLR